MPHAGKVLIIANPTARNGAAAAAAQQAARLLRAQLGETCVDVTFTQAPRHATQLAAHASGYATVCALGGDGLVHEVAGGLLQRPAAQRPALGVLPQGSGNDYARALGISFSLERACGQFLAAQAMATDVGRVNGECFAETLSFGVDAAIALDTVQRRVRTGRTGTILYLEAGIDQMLHHLEERPYAASFDDGRPVQASSITFAVQVGPYYGGGFKICPDARLDDGLLDVCISHPPLSVPRAVYIFLRAKNGGHTGFPQVELLRARRLHIEFDTTPPAQVDGERIEATTFDIEVLPNALQVLRP